MTTTDSVPVRLEVPADPRFLTVVRLTSAGVGADAGLTVEEIEDLKIAVDEACALQVDPVDATATVSVTFRVSPGHLDVDVDRRGDGDPPEIDELVQSILEATTDSHEQVRIDGGHRIRLTKSTAGE